jgi:hypothetical protein
MLWSTPFLAAGIAEGIACAASLFHWHCFVVDRAHGVKTNRGTIEVGLTPQFTPAPPGAVLRVGSCWRFGYSFCLRGSGRMGSYLLRSAVTKDRIPSFESSSQLDARLEQRWCSLLSLVPSAPFHFFTITTKSRQIPHRPSSGLRDFLNSTITSR